MTLPSSTNESAQRPWAVVTGASSGLGAEFARELAARGHNLVLTARREAPMRALAAKLSLSNDLQVLIEPLDLTAPDASEDLERRLSDQGVAPDVLVNNAGFGLHGPFLGHEPARLRDMLHLDVMALTDLTLRFGRRMQERGSGHILLVASMAAFQPTPLYAAYGAAKAYVLSLGEALHVELAPSVGVTVLSPGLMDTGFLDVAGQEPSPAMKRNMVKPADAVRLGLTAMYARKPAVITGGVNRVMAFSNRLTSRNLQARMILRVQQS